MQPKTDMMKKLRCAAFAFFAAASAAFVRAETVKVAECVRDAAIDVWAAHDVKFCCDVMTEVFALAGIQPVRVGFDADGMVVVSNAEVICSAFRTPTLEKDYEFSRQPLGRMHLGLYALPDRAEMMLSMKISDWPRIRVAYSPVSQGRDRDRENYFEHAGLTPEYLEYRTSAGAVDSLCQGDSDLLFLYTPYGKRPSGLEEIVPIGMRNVYFAVRKDRPDILHKLNSAFREWYIDNIDKYDIWREQLLGIPPPRRRVRIAAYQRGDLFNVTADGSRNGTIEEWVRSICAITHWTADYVYGDYDESYRDVQNGRLDMIGGLGFIPSRMNYFRYPHTPIGMLRVYLWAHPNSRYESGHPETWKGMRIGILSGTLSGERVKKQLGALKYGITTTEYQSDAELKKAYFSGEVDACVDVEMPELANERALQVYASHPMYLVTAYSRTDLFNELEAALDKVCDDFPKYMRMISERHYGSHNELAEFTSKESEWLAERIKDPTPIVIDFSPWPYKIHDENGKLMGMPKAFVDELTRITGLKFEVVPQTEFAVAEAKFMRKDTKFWIPFPKSANLSSYSATSVCSIPVPQNYAMLYGAEDMRTEFEMLTHHNTPQELVSILRKAASSIDPSAFQQMFIDAAAESMAERYFFGLTDAQLKEAFLICGVGFLVLLVICGSIFIVVLRRHARIASRAAEIANESAQAKTRFLAMMSHELRTPLNAVIGFAEFLSDDKIEEGTRREYVQGIMTSASALLELINDILDLSKLEAGAMIMRSGVCNIEKLMAELPAIFGHRVSSKGVELIVRRKDHDDVPPLKLSQQGIRQVLINLVGNASKFTQHGYIIVEYGWFSHTRTLHISITDTGRGISHEKMERLFEPFVQDIASRMMESSGGTKGTGLGLPIVKRLIDNAEGTIAVESEVGHGTKFIIDIPALEVIVANTPADIIGGEARPERDADAPKKPLPGKVLVVDDMMMNRKILGIHLKNLGITDVHFAENGLRALDEMKDWKPDVILTDMWMPEMNGQQLSEAMRHDKTLAEIPVVAVTADVDIDSTYNMKLFTRIISKPVTGAKLKKLFEDM